MITSVPEYMLHYQLEYLEEQNCLKIYNNNILKKLIPLEGTVDFCERFVVRVSEFWRFFLVDHRKSNSSQCLTHPRTQLSRTKMGKNYIRLLGVVV